MNTKTLIKIVIVAALATMILPTLALAQTEMTASFQWTAPTTGSAVDHYVVQHQEDGGAWTDLGTVATNQYVLTATEGVAHSIRVAAVDAQSRQGVWSEASDPYTPDPGAPGQPGKPIIF